MENYLARLRRRLVAVQGLIVVFWVVLIRKSIVGVLPDG